RLLRLGLGRGRLRRGRGRRLAARRRGGLGHQMFSVGGPKRARTLPNPRRAVSIRIDHSGKDLLGCSVMGRGREVEVPWKKARGVDAVVDRWLESKVVRPCFTADETVPPRIARMAPFPKGLPTPI